MFPGNIENIENAGVLGKLSELVSELTKVSEKIGDDLMFFPASHKWHWLPLRKRNLTIGPGKTYELWDESGNGWIYYAMFSANSPDLQVLIDVYADRVLDLAFSFNDLYNDGNINVGQGYFNLTRYDTTNNVYVMQYAPIGLGVPFRGRNTCKLRNPTTSTITVNSFAWLIILK